MTKKKPLSTVLRDGGVIREVDIRNDPYMRVVTDRGVTRVILLAEELQSSFIAFFRYLNAVGFGNKVRIKSPRAGSFCSSGFLIPEADFENAINKVLLTCPYDADAGELCVNYPRMRSDVLSEWLTYGKEHTDRLTAFSKFYYWVGLRRFRRPGA